MKHVKTFLNKWLPEGNTSTSQPWFFVFYITDACVVCKDAAVQYNLKKISMRGGASRN